MKKTKVENLHQLWLDWTASIQPTPLNRGLGTPVVVLPASVPLHPHPTVYLQHEDKVIPSEHNQVTTDSEMAPTSHREQTQPPQRSSGFVDAPLSWGSAVPLSYSPQPPGFPAALDHTRPLPPAFASLLPASAKFSVRLWPVRCLFPVLALALPWPRAITVAAAPFSSLSLPSTLV